MADEFATPVGKLSSISTRSNDGDKPSKPITYDDILRDQISDHDNSAGADHRMHENQGGQRQMDQIEHMQQMPMQVQQHQTIEQPMTQYPRHDFQNESRHDYEERRHRDDGRGGGGGKQRRSWLMTKMSQHKTDIIVAIVVFLVLMFVLPRLRNIPRFENGIPAVVLGLISIATGSVTNTIILSV
jgi:hypothetical protein